MPAVEKPHRNNMKESIYIESDLNSVKITTTTTSVADKEDNNEYQ